MRASPVMKMGGPARDTARFAKRTQMDPLSGRPFSAWNGHTSDVAAMPVSIRLPKIARPEPFAGTTSIFAAKTRSPFEKTNPFRGGRGFGKQNEPKFLARSARFYKTNPNPARRGNLKERNQFRCSFARVQNEPSSADVAQI